MTETTAVQHAQRRTRRLTAGILTSLGSRVVAAAVPLIMIPLTLSYLGDQLYGLWMAVAALTGLAAFADLGLGSGLMTKLVPCYASGDTHSARRHISNAYAMVAGLALLMIAALVGVSDVISWTAVFNVVDPTIARHTTGIVVVCLSAFLVNVPLSLVTRVQYAYQRVGQANVWQTFGSLLGIPLVLIAIHLQWRPELIVLAAVAGPPLSNAINSFWLFGHQLPKLTPHPRDVDRAASRELLTLGSRFLLLTIVMSLAVNADNLIVAHVLGLKAVTAFAVPARLFAQIGLVVSLVNVPLWPANGEALARGDYDWVRRITKRMTIASTLAVAAPSLVLVLAGQRLLTTWLGPGVHTSRLLMVGLALWWIMLAGISARFMVQNSVGIVAPQLIGWSLYLVLSVPLKWWATSVFGLEAIPFVGAGLYALVVVPAAVYGYRRAMAGNHRINGHGQAG